MYILKNVLTSIKRNKGRNILISIIIIVIAASCAITLSIMNSANKIVNAYHEKYQIKATIGMNRQNLMHSFKKDDASQEDMINTFNNMEGLTISQIENYKDSKYVKSYYYTYSLGMNANGLIEATDSLMKETNKTETKEFNDKRPGGDNFKSSIITTEKYENIKAKNGAFTLIGYSSYEAMTEFIEGSYTITEGEVSSDFSTNTCVISEELAILNNISVGDTITLVNPNNTDLTYELKVTGIYKENTNISKDMKNMFTNSANNIITNSTVVENIINADSTLEATITPTFILNDSEDVSAFITEVEEKGLSEYYSVSSNVDEIESATKSIVNVKNFATTFLVITLIIGGVVLLVINMINIRERKYEIGVLRTIGMSKTKVISQFVIELLTVSIISLIIGTGIGSLCSVSVANNLLENEINNSQEQINNINQNFGGKMFNPNDRNPMDNKQGSNNRPNHGNNIKINGVANIEQVDNINAVVDMKVLGELLLIGISLTVISSLSACIAIARFSPLTILKERS